MKKKHSLLGITMAMLTILAGRPFCYADGDHAHNKHEHKPLAAAIHAKVSPTPNGGRLITSVTPHLEFWVTDDRKVRLTALGDAHEAVALSGQSAKLVGGNRAKPTHMAFTEQDGALVSDIALPAGNFFPVVLMITPAPGANMVMVKFNVNLNACSSCKYKEYACICGHEENSQSDDDDEHEHPHKYE